MTQLRVNWIIHPIACRAFLSMSNAQALVAERFSARPALRSRLRVICLVASGFLPAAGADAATPGKSYFFATRDACVASGVFLQRECDAAFANASAELVDRSPRFATGADCRLRFHLCEMRRVAPEEDRETAAAEEEPGRFVPMALGVEMVATGKGVMAAPVLAVETPASLFPKVAVARAYEARDTEPPKKEAANSTILPADHFEPFRKRRPFDGAATFSAYALGALGDTPHIEAAQSFASQESPEERRARLKNAPFIE